jgi:hypothetical protein
VVILLSNLECDERARRNESSNSKELGYSYSRVSV